MGTLEMTPAFKPEVLTYTAETTNATNKITAETAKKNADMSITVNGTAMANGDAATWKKGTNTVQIVVRNGTTKQTYTVEVTKS